MTSPFVQYSYQTGDMISLLARKVSFTDDGLVQRTIYYPYVAAQLHHSVILSPFKGCLDDEIDYRMKSARMALA